MSLDIPIFSPQGKSLSEQDQFDYNQKDYQRKKSEKKDEQLNTIPEDDKIIHIGVCAMNKKVSSKPMQKILQLLKTKDFEIIIFDEDTILQKPIQEWPIIDCFISWFSAGFPLLKAQQYVKLRNPFSINDLEKQDLLFDRTIIYKLLKHNKVPICKSYFVYRNQEQPMADLSQNKITLNMKRNSCDEDSQVEEKKSINNDDTFNSQLFSNDDISPCLTPRQKFVPNSLKENLLLSNESSNIKKERKIVRSKSLPKNDSDPDVIDPNQPNGQKEFKPTTVEEFEDYILIDGHKLQKPFVEKPFDAEDHNIYIYYPQSDGGGCKKLFRKIENKSSDYDKDLNTIRRDQNMVYEIFLPTNGFDIKVYTVGPDYTHAEARKAPVLDGIVQRTKEGKEVRYPVILTPEEKFISQKIVKIFGQNICGFDLLRANGKSYVCDVNGWSFVKGSQKYFKDCAFILRQMIYQRFAPKKLSEYNERLQQNILKDLKKNSYRPNTIDGVCANHKEELRSVVAIFRHADRTPKQKMKMKTNHSQYINFYLANTKDTPNKELKVKSAKLLQSLLNISREIFEDQKNKGGQITLEEDCCFSKLVQMISVLEKGGQFEGINRKIQLKPIDIESSDETESSDQIKKEQQIPTKILIVLKWGGELTHTGEQQSEDLGNFFRDYLYPGVKDGLLRLHSTYRHDLKTYTSDEGRCQKTAGAFLKGFLSLEGDIAPIMASMLTKNEVAYQLLDQSSDILENDPVELQIAKDISSLMNSEENLFEAFKKKFGKTRISQTMQALMQKIDNPRKRLEQIHKMIKNLTKGLFQILNISSQTYYVQPSDWKTEQDMIEQSEQICGNESLILLYKRWRKLSVDFVHDNKYNISKIPDVYDNIKYDYIHNRHILLQVDPDIATLYEEAEMMSNFVLPYEFGMNEEEKVQIAMKVVQPLCNKIKNDLVWWQEKNFYEDEFWKYTRNNDELDLRSPWRHIKTRLYFTSASHLYSLFNIIHLGLESRLIENEEKYDELESITSLQYLSHILFRLYENLLADTNDPERFRLELSISPGCQHNTDIIAENTHSTPVKPLILINKKLNIVQIKEFFTLLEGRESLLAKRYMSQESEQNSQDNKQKEQKQEYKNES